LPITGKEELGQAFSIVPEMFKRSSSPAAARCRQQAERCMQIACLMSNRKGAKALRKLAAEHLARAEKIEKDETGQAAMPLSRE
jgi:hypothetical protein